MSETPGANPNSIPDLMPFMVREVLLVSTLYDSFILEEDGRFSDKLFSQYMELNLSSPPRLHRASNGQQCLSLLKERHFDLVILMSRVADTTPQALATQIKESNPELPVVMLAYDHSLPLDLLGGTQCNAIDKTFVWTGDNRLLLVLIKSVEDMMNVENDTRVGMVRTIIVVEDSPHYYSRFLTLMYTEIMEQTRFLIEDSLNYIDRIRRMRARPKILLATTYEDGAALYTKYKDSILGVVSDVRLPRKGITDPKAGLAFLNSIQKQVHDIPILVQSAEPENRAKAEKLGLTFIDKSSPDMLSEIRTFIRTQFGFGDFVFRDESNIEIARASNMAQMKQTLATVDEKSLKYHASRQHISNWLMARGEFPLAMQLRRHNFGDFQSIDSLRTFMLNAFTSFLELQQRGRITDFSRGTQHLGRDFVRLGGGSLGGKGRGVAFIYSLLSRSDIHERFPGVKILVPRTTVICTNEFDRFVEHNNLRERVANAESADEIGNLFLKTRISNEVHKDLEVLLEEVRYPLAVRSSSLLEDSQFQPFAGVYATYMLPNNDPSLRVRLRQLRRAIKLVYASTFFPGSEAYMNAINRRVEEEKMAVLIQRLVGSEQNEARFYPTFSGVAQSYNYYPIRYMKPEDGIATVAIGLGRTVVEGGKALRFSPKHPHVLPQMSTPELALKNSQRNFFALDLSQSRVKVTLDEEETLAHPGLEVAELDGTLSVAGATYVANAGKIYDTIHRDGVRLVNFAPVLKHGEFPLADLLSYMLELGCESMGCPVEIEFAVNMEVAEGRKPEFAVLQIRPLVTADVNAELDIDSVDTANILLQSTRALGNGVISDIRDIVYISPDRFDAMQTLAMVEEVAKINAGLADEARPYVLIGPGRWGTSDRFLGIPVNWMQVSAARIIVELGTEGFDVDPSQGTHFFHNITSLRVGYMTVDNRKSLESIDWNWLAQQSPVQELKFARHVRLAAPLEARLDGRTGRGVLIRN